MLFEVNFQVLPALSLLLVFIHFPIFQPCHPSRNFRIDLSYAVSKCHQSLLGSNCQHYTVIAKFKCLPDNIESHSDKRRLRQTWNAGIFTLLIYSSIYFKGSTFQID